MDLSIMENISSNEMHSVLGLEGVESRIKILQFNFFDWKIRPVHIKTGNETSEANYKLKCKCFHWLGMIKYFQ